MKKLYLFAKENIYDAYSQKIVYLKDELVGNIHLLKENNSELPKGNYYIQESLDDEKMNIRVEERLEDSTYYENLFLVKSTISISLQVKDIFTHQSLDGVHLGLFALDDIYDKNDKIIYHKDDLISDIISKKNKIFQVPMINLNAGTFYIAQIDTIEGYYGSLEQVPIHVDFVNNITDFVVTFYNAPTIVEVNKLDSYYQYLPGAWLLLYDDKGDLVDEWISEKEHRIYRLSIDKKYVIKEAKAPVGYARCPDTYFIVQNKNNGVQTINLLNKKIN